MPPKPLDIPADRVVAAVNQSRLDHGRCTVQMVADILRISTNTAWRRLRRAIDDGTVESLGRSGYRVTGERLL